MSFTSLILVPDSLDTPMGGMGVQLRGILNGSAEIGSEMRFLVVGSSGEALAGSNFEYRSLCPSGDPSRMMSLFSLPNIGYTQTNYFDIATALVSEAGPIDLVHVFDWSTMYAGFTLSQRFSVPLVSTFQLSMSTLLLELGRRVPMMRTENLNNIVAIETSMLAQSAVVIQVSESCRRFWSITLPQYADKQVVIPNATEPSPSRQPVPMYLQSPLFRIGYIGRCSMQKSSEKILEAVMSDAWPEGKVKLFWAGNGNGGDLPLWQMAVDISQQFPERLELVGYLDGVAKWAFLQHCDAILFPSVYEPFGIVGLEAMSAGTLLLTSRVDGISEYASERNSIFAPPNRDGILSAIVQAVEIDPDLRRTLVENGIQTSKEFQWSSSARRLEAAYLSALGDAPQGKSS